MHVWKLATREGLCGDKAGLQREWKGPYYSFSRARLNLGPHAKGALQHGHTLVASFLYVCVLTCGVDVIVRVCTSSSVWRPEVDFLCIPQLLSTLFSETGSLTEPGACCFGKTSHLPLPSSPLPPGVTGTYPNAHFFRGCWESEFRFFCLHSQHFTH